MTQVTCSGKNTRWLEDVGFELASMHMHAHTHTSGSQPGSQAAVTVQENETALISLQLPL